ncbi:MAG: hypothetical protein LBQ91_03385 [Oscillospiraceae bacterium]|nr:hypothetical protein [Oscillospiraceae bacterium]
MTQSPETNQTRDVEDAVPYGSPKATGTQMHARTYSHDATILAATGDALHCR